MRSRRVVAIATMFALLASLDGCKRSRGARPAVSLAVGSNRCVLAGDVARCWGESLQALEWRLPAVRALVAHGASEVCALLDDGSIRCLSARGESSRASNSTVPSDAAVSVPSDAIAIEASALWTCSRHRDGRVRCWNTEQPPREIAALRGATSLSLGSVSGCALLAGGAVRCWRGFGSSIEPREVAPIEDVSSVLATSEGGCALTHAGLLWCWTQTTDGLTSMPRRVEGFPALDRVWATASTVVAQAKDGTVWAVQHGRRGAPTVWDSRARSTQPSRLPASNDGGLAFLFEPEPEPTAVQLDDWRSATRVVHGRSGVCAVFAANRQLRCVGLVGPLEPDSVELLLDGEHAVNDAIHCAVLSGDRVRCIGSETGPFSSELAAAPPGLGAVRAIASGAGHQCAIGVDGLVRCWGRNHHGQLGLGDSATRAVPARVSELGPVKAIAAGSAHTCALDERGAVHCWGDNEHGQLGQSGEDRASPARVSGLPVIAAIAAGAAHTCAIATDGGVWCWGLNRDGQLGLSDQSPLVTSRSQPARVRGLRAVRALALGALHTCAVSEERAVQCWGCGLSGQLGDGAQVSRDEPREVPGISGVLELSAGHEHTCALLDDGRGVRCWGRPLREGRPGRDAQWRSPMPVETLQNASTIASGASSTCGWISGRIVCAQFVSM